MNEVVQKIYHGDFLKVSPIVKNEFVDLIVTDPPWGVNAWQKGNYIDSGEFVFPLIQKWVNELYRILKWKRHIFIFVPTKAVDIWVKEFTSVFGRTGFHGIVICQNMKKGKSYSNKFRLNYQMIIHGSKGIPIDFNEVDWIKKSESWLQDKRNIDFNDYTYSYPAYLPDYVKATIEHRTGTHADEKNFDLIENLLLIASKEYELVFDPFAGSGVVLEAAKRNKRNYVGVELNRKYYEEILGRLKNTLDAREIERWI